MQVGYPEEDDDDDDGQMAAAMALNAQLKAMASGGQVDPAVLQRLMQQMNGMGGDAPDYPREPRGQRAVSRRGEETRRRARGGVQRRRPPSASARSSVGIDFQPPRTMARKRTNYTHDQYQRSTIDTSNTHLLSKLSAINNRATSRRTKTTTLQRKGPRKSSNTINAKKKNSKIARENAAMAKRLAGAKSSTSLSRKNMRKHAKSQAKYGKMRRMQPNVRARSAPGGEAALPPLTGPGNYDYGLTQGY